MKKVLLCLLVEVCFSAFQGAAVAHFGMVIPSDTMVMPGENKVVTVTASFSHPFEMIGMDLERPARFGVMSGGEKVDLTGQLKEMKVMGRKAWMMNFVVGRPGVYTFYMEPQPYWEPAEDCFIVHYTKTVISAFGDEEGWDRPLGLKTEIVPLTRPFGLYEGNVFQGVVLVDGKPVPNASVEVEYYNVDKKAEAPTDYMITQVTKADAQGVFTWAVPRAGWWGFSALSTAAQKSKYEGKDKDIEQGAVLWVEFQSWKSR